MPMIAVDISLHSPHVCVHVHMCLDSVCVCMCVCVRACMHGCACMSVCVCFVGIQPPHGGEGNNIRAEEEEDFI